MASGLSRTSAIDGTYFVDRKTFYLFILLNSLFNNVRLKETKFPLCGTVFSERFKKRSGMIDRFRRNSQIFMVFRTNSNFFHYFISFMQFYSNSS